MKIKKQYNGGIMNYQEELYLMMEINYLKENNRSLADDNTDLFPTTWYLYDNYQQKAEILLEAINKKVKIVDTQKYKERSIDII